MKKVLIIDDEENILTSLEFALEDYYIVHSTTDPIQGIQLIKEKSIDVVILDLRIGQYDGISVLEKIKNKYNDISVIMMTAYGSIKSSVDAMKAGAFYYVTKPVDIEELKIMIEKALDITKLNQRVEHLENQLNERYSFAGIIGDSEKMKWVFSMIEKVKDIDTNILIYGESGTGKELIARAIHYQGIRKEERFEAINCAAIPEHLLESELFGYEKGAFSGAIRSKKGKFAVANKGTIFLDEIGEMDLGMQSKLLRVLQERELTPLGSNTPISVDLHVIAATNRNLRQEVKAGRFREDLYYRLNVISVEIPPLRERKEDIALLCDHFIKKYNQKLNKEVEGIEFEALQTLEGFYFNGNVRELENLIHRAVALTDSSKLRLLDFPSHMVADVTAIGTKESGIAVGQSLRDAERHLIIKTLEAKQYSKKETASVLGITERTLRNKLNEYREGGLID